MKPTNTRETHAIFCSRSAANKQQPSPGLSVRGNAVWSLAGDGGFALCQLGMLVVMARLGTQELVGQYAFGLAVASPIFLLFAFDHRTLLATHVGDDVEVNVHVTVRLATTATATIVAVLASWLFMSHGTAIVAMSIIASKAIDSFHDLIYGLYWRSNRMDYIAKSMLLRGIAGLAAFAVTLQFTPSVSAAVVALCAAWLMVLLVIDRPVVRHVVPNGSIPWWMPRWSSATARRLISLGFPAGILSWLVSLQTYVPRYFVPHDLGDAALGVFSALASIFIGLEMGVRSFNYAALPRLAEFAALRQNGSLSRLVRQLTTVGLVLAALLVAGSVVLARPLISLLFGASYAEHSAVFVILAFGFAIRTATMPTAMTLRAINAFWSLVVVQSLTVIGLFVACMILMPRYGLQGCAIASVIGFAVDGAARIVLHYLLVVRCVPTFGAAPDLAHAA